MAKNFSKKAMLLTKDFFGLEMLFSRSVTFSELKILLSKSVTFFEWETRYYLVSVHNKKSSRNKNIAAFECKS